MAGASKYQPEFCERVIAMGREGKSRAQMATELGVNRATLADWCAVRSEFAQAMDTAECAAEAYWEQVGIEGMARGKDFNDRVWSRLMAARFPRTWRESSRVDVQALVMQAPADVEALKADTLQRLARLQQFLGVRLGDVIEGEIIAPAIAAPEEDGCGLA